MDEAAGTLARGRPARQYRSSVTISRTTCTSATRTLATVSIGSTPAAQVIFQPPTATVHTAPGSAADNRRLGQGHSGGAVNAIRAAQPWGHNRMRSSRTRLL